MVRRINIFCLAVLFFANAAVADDYFLGYKKIPDRVIKLNENDKVDLTGRDIEIVVPEDSGNVAEYAAKELKTFMERSLDKKIQIVKASGGKAFPIILGDCETGKIKEYNVQELPRDSFVIKINKDSIVIAGPENKDTDVECYIWPGNGFNNDFSTKFTRGTWHGVVDFLERFLGIRFYFAGEAGTIVPELSGLKIPTGIIFDRPDKTLRHMPYTGGIWYDRSDPSYKSVVSNRKAKKIQYCRLKLSSINPPFTHGIAKRRYLERFADSHPEYFALKDGQRYSEVYKKTGKTSHNSQLCLSSKIKDEIIKDAVSYFSGEDALVRGAWAYSRKTYKGEKIKLWNEHREYNGEPSNTRDCFSLGFDDGFIKCECEECKKAIGGTRQGLSNYMWAFTNSIAKELKRQNIKGVVAQLAYTYAQPVPDFDLENNIVAQYCCVGPWVGMQEDTLDTIKRWGKKLDNKLFMWNYCINDGRVTSFSPGYTDEIPSVTPKAVGAFYKEMAPHVKGFSMEIYSKYYFYNHLNAYVFAKVNWDASTDVDALLDEYYKLMFGAAAEVMEQYHEELEDLWVNRICGKEFEGPLGPKPDIPSKEIVWIKVYNAEQMKKFGSYFDKAESLVQNDKQALSRVKLVRQEMFDRMKDYSLKCEEEHQAYIAERREARKTISKMNIFAVDRGGEKFVLDGKLDEEFWKKSISANLSGFKNVDDKNKLDGIYKVAFDEENIYLGFYMHEPGMNKVVASADTVSAKASSENDIEIFLNVSSDIKNFYQIMLTSAGVMDTRVWEFDSYSKKLRNKVVEPFCKSKVYCGQDYWTGEIVIPRGNFENINTRGFPVNFVRQRLLKGEDVQLYSWATCLEKGWAEVYNWPMMYFESEASRELLNDSSFKYGLRFWSCKEKTEAEVIEVDNPLESNILKVTWSYASGYGHVGQKLSGLEPNSTYSLSFMVKSELKSGRATASLWNGRTNEFFPRNNSVEKIVGNTAWSKKYFTFETGEKTNRYSITFKALGEGTVYYKDISVRKIPE